MKEHVAAILSEVETATLSTTGPAGLQARSFPCQTRGIILYLLLPGTSDQLLNLEQDNKVVVSTPGWQLRGWGRVLPLTAAPADLTMMRRPEVKGCVLVEVQPFQLQVHRQQGWGFSETLDIEPEAQDLT